MISTEWLEADGVGGFASGTASLIRTRRYHALLLAADPPPARRVVLVNGVEAWLEAAGATFALSSQRYAPDVTHPDGAARIARFSPSPWPQWTFELEDGSILGHELFVAKGYSAVFLRWRLVEGATAALRVRPLVSGRDYHALHRRNAAFRFEPQRDPGCLVFRPYDGVPGIVVRTNGEYAHQPDWYLNFQYDDERARGLDHVEDLAAPGLFAFDLTAGPAILILSAGGGTDLPGRTPPSDLFDHFTGIERTRRASFASPLERAADAYVVRRGDGKTIVAGYPWFTDWGRDSFIALRGLCLATDRLEDARQILLSWTETITDGMVPNRFLDGAGEQEFNAVDASLWFVVAVHEFITLALRAGMLAPRDCRRLERGVDAILERYAAGARYRIGVDTDGLLRCGEPGVQLTWMDARVDGREITPRIGKPVEVQALWLAALLGATQRSPRWIPLLEQGRRSFEARFWNSAGYLYDVVDVDHEVGRVDATFRPNQIFAVGGLPIQLLPAHKAALVVAEVEARLWTPLGLRSLARGEPGYVPHYGGGPAARDEAYHQGTVWPWLLGPFVEAWVRVRNDTSEARREARARFLEPLLAHLDSAGLGHISEIADAEPPHTPGGCPFQAWSVGETLRLDRVVLAEPCGSPDRRVADAASFEEAPVSL